MIDEDAIRQRWDAVGSKLDERGQRLFAAVEVRTAGWGGLALVSKITGLARSTIDRGRADLGAEPLPNGQVRRAGGGRRAVCENDPGLLPALKNLVEPATLGDPMRPLIWVSKSMDKLAAALTEMGHPISADTVDKELVERVAEDLPPVSPRHHDRHRNVRMRPMSRATHGYLMTAAGISPTYVDQPCAITRTGRHHRAQPDINFRRQSCFSSHFTTLSHPPRLPHNTPIPSLRDRVFTFPHLFAGLQCP